MTVLDDIVVGVREDLDARRARVPLADVEAAARRAPAPLDPMPQFRAAVIAEVKRKSPSKGQLATITDPATLAAQYADGGAH